MTVKHVHWLGQLLSHIYVVGSNHVDMLCPYLCNLLTHPIKIIGLFYHDHTG